MSDDEFELIEGSGNVLSRLGRSAGGPEAGEGDSGGADHRGASTTAAFRCGKPSELTGFAAADFSRIRNADLGRFTLRPAALKMLAALDRRLQVTVTL